MGVDALQAARSAEKDVTYSQVLKNRHYRNILGAQMVSNIGNWMEMVGIQMFVATTTGSLADQGQLSFYQLAPIPLFGIIGGLVADRVDRRKLLLVTQIMMALVAVGVAVISMVHFENPRTAIHWLFALGALQGTVMAFNMPAWQVLTPRLVPRHQLTKAITLNGIQFNMTRVVGPALAGLILAKYTAPPLFICNAVSFRGVIWAVAITPPALPPPPGRGGVRGQLSEAAAFIAQDKGVRAVFLAQLAISLLAAPLVRLLPIYVLKVYELPSAKDFKAALEAHAPNAAPMSAEQAAGWLLALQGVGAVIGGLSLRWIPHWYPKHHFIPLSVAGLGLSVSLFSLTQSLWLGFAAMLVCGFFWIWAFNQSWAAIQMLAPDSMRGRVLSITAVIAFGATALGAWIAGHVGEALIASGRLGEGSATELSLSMLAVPLFFAGLVMMAIRTPEVDGMNRTGNPRVDLNLLNAILARGHRPPTEDEPSPPANVV